MANQKFLGEAGTSYIIDEVKKLKTENPMYVVDYSKITTENMNDVANAWFDKYPFTWIMKNAIIGTEVDAAQNEITQIVAREGSYFVVSGYYIFANNNRQVYKINGAIYNVFKPGYTNYSEVEFMTRKFYKIATDGTATELVGTYDNPINDGDYDYVTINGSKPTVVWSNVMNTLCRYDATNKKWIAISSEISAADVTNKFA